MIHRFHNIRYYVWVNARPLSIVSLCLNIVLNVKALVGAFNK